VTAVTCLFIIQEEKKNQKKRNTKSKKIDKKKRNILVSKYIIATMKIGVFKLRA